MKRKLIGTVKVYLSVSDGCQTYETVWPTKLYYAVHGRTSTDQIKDRTVTAWSKRLAPQKMVKL